MAEKAGGCAAEQTWDTYEQQLIKQGYTPAKAQAIATINQNLIRLSADPKAPVLAEGLKRYGVFTIFDLPEEAAIRMAAYLSKLKDISALYRQAQISDLSDEIAEVQILLPKAPTKLASIGRHLDRLTDEQLHDLYVSLKDIDAIASQLLQQIGRRS